MKRPDPLTEHFATLAKKDPGFAIAYALMTLAEKQEAIGEALDRLGMNDAGYGNNAPGVFEKIAIELADLVQRLSEQD